MSRFGPTDPAEYGGGPLNDQELEADGWAAGLDVWGPVSKVYSDAVQDSALANAQLWSLREAIRQELLTDPEAALSAPSEPVQDQPRVWAMPEIPEDVTRLRDTRDGDSWVRATWENHPSDPAQYWTNGDALISLGHLLQSRGPLTEVVEPDGD